MRTRILLGSLLAALAGGMFYVDHHVGPQAPVLFIVAIALAAFGTIELIAFLPPARRPREVLCVLGCIALISCHWLPRLGLPGGFPIAIHVFVGLVILAMIDALANYREPGESGNRLATGVFGLVYLGLLPGYLAALRTTQTDAISGTVSLLLAVFVPKGCDIGAYFTGKLLGKHKMTPILSPKKTWEGLAGGLAMAVLVSCGLQAWHPVIPFGWPGVVGFGLTVGAAGVLGDLLESLLKRDAGKKDASHALPEFGGVLDVVDAILFAAPVVYWWLKS